MFHWINSEIVTTLGSGTFAFGLAGWHWGKTGVVQCDVKYSESEPLHQEWNDILVVDMAMTRSTLVTRVCIRWDTLSDDQKWCGPWGTKSDFHQTLPFGATCSLNGPNVNGFVPTHEQRDAMRNKLYSAFEDKTIHTPELLRASFHDASTFSSNDLEVRGGAQGCMQYDHIHGNSANRGLAFFIDHLPGAIGCDNWNCPFSVADILQYAGSVAVEYAQGPIFSSTLKWGRVDAPYNFCLGGLQLNMPDANGGHNEGLFASVLVIYKEDCKQFSIPLPRTSRHSWV